MHLLLLRTLPPEVPLFSDGEFGTLAFGKRYPPLVALSDNKDVGDTGIDERA